MSKKSQERYDHGFDDEDTHHRFEREEWHYDVDFDTEVGDYNGDGEEIDDEKGDW